MTSTIADNYPGERTLTETDRLHNQHDLVVNAFGSLLLCPLNTSKTNLRLLDIGTADGWYLHCLRKELTDPESATLTGTDVAEYPDAVENVIIHNFKTPFSGEWKASFDFVQLRGVLASSGSQDSQGIDLIRRALELIKPGGWIQLVDSSLLVEEFNGADKPSTKLFKTVADLLTQVGMNPALGRSIAGFLKQAGGDGITNQGEKTALVKIGKGADNIELSWNWLRGFCNTGKNGLVKAGSISADDFDDLQAAVFEETEKEGFSFPWYATWAQKV